MLFYGAVNLVLRYTEILCVTAIEYLVCVTNIDYVLVCAFRINCLSVLFNGGVRNTFSLLYIS